MTILLFLIISYVLLSVSLYLLFPKANKKAVDGLIPGSNFMVWCDIIGRKRAYALWLLFPIVNIFIFCGMAVDLVRSFGRYKLSDSALAVIYAPLIFFQIARNDRDQYVGQTVVLEKEYKLQLKEAMDAGNERKFKKLQEKSPYKKTVGREWAEAIFFAVFAAAFIRMFLIEAYTIPTSSMEGSLKVGDYLFVSKAHYGIRTPQTVLQIPLLHNRIPILNRESYLSKPSLPYFRLPGLTKIKRNDPVVFNWPIGDQVYIAPDRTYSQEQVGRELTKNDVKNWPYVERPMDKTDFYIKRCVAIAGDSLEIINKQIYINGQPADNPEKIQYSYQVRFPKGINRAALIELDAYPLDVNRGAPVNPNGLNIMSLNSEQVSKLKELGAQVSLVTTPVGGINLFPHDKKHVGGMSVDNFGPIWIPEAGATIPLNMNNISFFNRIIDVYEDHDLEIKGNKIFIDGEEVKEYTFEYDYYWMMGDNRHNSEDSRFWGYVPETHIVGKPLFIWMSTKFGSMSNGIRWDRIFTGARKM